MCDYADRKDESILINQALSNDISVVFLMAGKAFGITSFLCDKLSIELLTKQKQVFYLNAAIEPNIATAIMNSIIKDSAMYAIMQECLNKTYGEKESSAMESILQGIPYVGNVLSFAVNQKSSIPIYTGSFASAIEEILTIFIKEYATNEIIIIIDSAQEILESSYNLISDLINYNNVKFILAITEKNDNFFKLSNFINLKKYKNTELLFPAPSMMLVTELAKLYQCDIKPIHAENILFQSEGNIHKIVRNLIAPDTDYHLDIWGKAIVSILDICAFPLSKKVLSEIVNLCHLYSNDFQETFSKTLLELHTASIISLDADNYELYSRNHPEVGVLLDSYADQIIYKKIVFSYFKKNPIYNKKIVTLLYKLALEFDDASCSLYARYLIKYYLQDGTRITDSLIDSANFKKSEISDCILASIVYSRRRDYSSALKWIPKNNLSDMYLEAYYGILLNRTRNHDEAEMVLHRILDQFDHDLERKALIFSFLISNYIHSEELEKAQSVYKSALKECSNCKNLGYLIRNATSAFAGQTLEMYNDALSIFYDSNDMLGYYTTLCNKGYSLLSTDAEQGKQCLLDSYNYLKLFGENIAHIVSNDLGIAYLFSNDYNNAKFYFERVIANEKNKMPSIFAKINLACCDALAGNTSDALNAIQDIESLVEESSLDRIKQKYYINRLFIEYICQYPIDNSVIKKASMHLDRYDQNKTLSLIAFYKKHLRLKSKPDKSNWQKLYSACGLVYWLVEPLKILPESILDDIMPI